MGSFDVYRVMETIFGRTSLRLVRCLLDSCSWCGYRPLQSRVVDLSNDLQSTPCPRCKFLN